MQAVRATVYACRKAVTVCSTGGTLFPWCVSTRAAAAKQRKHSVYMPCLRAVSTHLLLLQSVFFLPRP